jgi:hypothetical protein
MSGHENALRSHYEQHWGRAAKVHRVSEGPLWDLPPDYHGIAFAPRASDGYSRLWTYATCGMSQPGDSPAIEVFIESPVESLRVVELLTMTAHYHRTGRTLGWSHTVYFGTPWLPDSQCDHGLLSLPYLDGPKLEKAALPGIEVQVLWLIPITKDEREYKISHGLEALEQLFEKSKSDYSDPRRQSVLASNG